MPPEEFFPFDILLVQRDEVAAYIETTRLKNLGCKVKHVKAAFDAIGVLKERNQRFDFIFLDIFLYDMAGSELIETIRPLIPEKTKLVILTSFVDQKDYEYLSKHEIKNIFERPVPTQDFKLFFQTHLLQSII